MPITVLNTVVLDNAVLAQNQATGNNTNPVTLSGLSFYFAPNSKYRFWFMGRVQPNAATTGCGFQLDVDNAVTEISMIFYNPLTTSGGITGGYSIADDASEGVSSGFPSTGSYPVYGSGIMRTGANGGIAQLRFRSETNAIITALAGLTLVVEKIS